MKWRHKQHLSKRRGTPRGEGKVRASLLGWVGTRSHRGRTRQKDRRGGESSKAEGQEKDGQTGLERKGQERK